MTKFFFKINLVITVVTVIYCVAVGVSFRETVFRGVIVFAGLYAIMLTFFIGLRMIFNPNSGKGMDIEQRRSG
jgi:hypothetical protein